MVVANAGIASYGSVLAVDPATFKRVIDINLLGVFHTVRAALPSVIENKGYVLVVSSMAAFGAMAGLASYNASKAGVEHFANALRLEVKHLGRGRRRRPHVLDRHPVGARRPRGPHRLRADDRDAAAADEQDHVGGGLRQGLRRRDRSTQAPDLRARLGRDRGRGADVLNSRMLEAGALRHIPKLLPLMDEEVRRLGRSTSIRNVELSDEIVDR